MSVYPLTSRVRIDVDGVQLADTLHAMELCEANYPPRLYLPREDVDMSRLVASETSTHCPFKGDASYFSIVLDDGVTYPDAVWTYEHPLDGAAAIRGRLVFDPRVAQACVES